MGCEKGLTCKRHLAGENIQTLKGRSPIGHYETLSNVITSTFEHKQSRPTCISSGAVGMTMNQQSVSESHLHRKSFGLDCMIKGSYLELSERRGSVERQQ